MVVSDVKYCSKTKLLYLCYNLSAAKTCYQWLSINYNGNGYQLLTVISAKTIDIGNYNVSLEQMFTTLTIISLVAARVLAIQKYGHSRRDDRGCKGSIYVNVISQAILKFHMAGIA